jgi:hypothetical protein
MQMHRYKKCTSLSSGLECVFRVFFMNYVQGNSGQDHERIFGALGDAKQRLRLIFKLFLEYAEKGIGHS